MTLKSENEREGTQKGVPSFARHPFFVISKAPLICQGHKLSYKSNARESQFSLAFDFADI